MGLMSGTSVDGVDACLARFWEADGQVRHEIIAVYSREIPDALRNRLLSVMAEQTVSLADLCALNLAVGKLFAETAMGLLEQFRIPADAIAAIGSHGQTLYHAPPVPSSWGAPGALGGTLQIGEPSLIAERTGIPVVADFRPRDMAAGGQGAPLVCFADRVLFGHDTLSRAVQNIGGIANVTMLPSALPSALPSDTEQRTRGTAVIAFDTGPGNMLMDVAMRHFYGKTHDAGGDTAFSGTVHEALLDRLMAHPYLRQKPPKTTGREDFGDPFFHRLKEAFPNVAAADWVATLNRYTAQSIVDAYEHFLFPGYTLSEMIVGGGGIKNACLLANLRRLFQENRRSVVIKTHADFGIPDQYKEALAFALLAWKNLLGEPNTLPSCTGASHPVVMGKRMV